MRRHYPWIALVVFVTTLALSAAEDPAQLKARADAAHGGQQVKLCLQYAHVQLETANKLFDGGNAEQGQAAINDVVEYSRRAADAAATTGKHLKDTEINLRKLADRMHDIGESLAFEDRQPVRQAVEQLQQIRSDLMVKMWGPQAEPKGTS